jgi:hypothetical protein
VCVPHGDFLQHYYVYWSLCSFPSVLVDGASVLIYCSALRWERDVYIRALLVCKVARYSS